MNRMEVEEPFEGLLDQVTMRLSLEFNPNRGRVCVKAWPIHLSTLLIEGKSEKRES